MARALSNLFIVQVVSARALPLWLRPGGQELPLFQWIDIPNSVLNDTKNLPDTYFLSNGSGLTPPSRRPAPRTGQVNWDGSTGANKYGIPSVRWNEISWFKTHYSYSGMGFDSRGSRILLGGGDAHWAENSYHRFTFGVDVPFWEPALIRSTNYLDFKTNDMRLANGPLPQTRPGDDDRVDRNYDGRHRGGHTYWSQWFIEARNWICHFETHQYWPVDFGYTPNVHIADLNTGDWRQDEPIAPVPVKLGDANQWKWKHPITEDVYQLLGEYCFRWHQGGNAWEVIYHFDMPPFHQWGTTAITGGLNWQDNYLLFEGKTGSGNSVRLAFILDLNQKEGRNLAKKLDVSLTGPMAPKISTGAGHAYHPFVWNPDLQMFLVYDDHSAVYTIQRTGPTTFHCDQLQMSGAAPAEQAIYRHKGGGVLSGFQYVPELKGMVLRLDDRLSMKFFRTG